MAERTSRWHNFAMETTAAARPADATDLQALYSRPGFLMRRAHQIAVSDRKSVV